MQFKDLAIKYKDHLIIADLHIGIEEALNKRGILIPRFQLKELKERIIKLLTEDIKTVVIAGDLKHEFGTISEQEWRHTLEILDLFKERNIILIKGNHDTILTPIANKANLEIKDSYEIDNISIQHGNKIIETKADTIIIGHEHPAIKIEDEIRNETYKCFLKGKYKNKTIIVLPSFNLVTKGMNVLNEKTLSPYLEDISDFEVFVVEDKVYNFGKIKTLNEVKQNNNL
jgi:uncharacterized protein